MGVASGCGYQEVGVVGRRRVWLVGGMYWCGYQEVCVASGWNVCVWLSGGGCGWKSIGVVSGCFPHITCIFLLHLYLFFFAAAPYFFFHFVKMIFRSCLCYFCAIL